VVKQQYYIPVKGISNSVGRHLEPLPALNEKLVAVIKAYALWTQQTSKNNSIANYLRTNWTLLGTVRNYIIVLEIYSARETFVPMFVL
jgi:hypothetical protein